MANWLLKTEPDTFSINDLAAAGVSGEPWNGIRNYPARNFLRSMAPSDRVLIYHSSCAQPEVVSLKTLKAMPELVDMVLLRQPRLSVSPVSDSEWRRLAQR